MKYYFLFGLLFLTALFFRAKGQSPQGINYQGVARDLEGKPLASQNISVRISILKDAVGGETEFAETHSIKTNSFGLFMLVIGQGNAVTGSFEFVSWAMGNKWLQIELDPAGGNSFQLLGSQQLMSVPYAFYSTYSGNGLTAGQGIEIQNNQISNTGDSDNSAVNELISDVSFGPDNKLKITDAGGTKEADLSSLVGAAQNLSDVLSMGNDAGGQKITNLAMPATPTDATTKLYVDNHTDGDSNTSNEIQDLNLLSNNLKITNNNVATIINLAPYLDNTDKQNLTLTGADLSIENGNAVNLSSVNTDNQNLSLTGSSLAISNGNNVSLAPFLDNTDSQTIAIQSINTDTRNISISGGNNLNFSVADNDNSITNEIQMLTKTGTQISLSDGGGSVTLNDDSNTNEIQLLSKTGGQISLSSGGGVVTIVDDSDTNELQDLSRSGNTLSLSGDVTSVDLSPYLDNTDSQALSTQSVDANTRSIAITGGNTINVDVRDADANATNEIQDLSISGNILSLSSDATTVNLATYLDNTDNQDLSLTGNTLSLTNDATTINLSTYLDNTDSQTLSTQSVDANTRSIAITGGNTVNVDVRDADASITNEIQNLGNSVSGTQRTITISGGTSTTIDVADNDNDATNELQNLNQVLTRGRDAGGIQIQNLGAPVAGTDGTTKSYVDNAIATAVATNYAFKATYTFVNTTGDPFTDSPIGLTDNLDDFNVVDANKFTAPAAGTYLFTVSGNSLLGGIPVKLKITSGTTTFYDVKRQAAYPLSSTINYVDSNIYKLNPGDTVELVVTSTMNGERVEGVLFGYKL
ncbi:MAG: hypothetical protein AABY93_13720 [Bacteroidota bacterium]